MASLKNPLGFEPYKRYLEYEQDYLPEHVKNDEDLKREIDKLKNKNYEDKEASRRRRPC